MTRRKGKTTSRFVLLRGHGDEYLEAKPAMLLEIGEQFEMLMHARIEMARRLFDEDTDFYCLRFFGCHGDWLDFDSLDCERADVQALEEEFSKSEISSVEVGGDLLAYISGMCKIPRHDGNGALIRTDRDRMIVTTDGVFFRAHPRHSDAGMETDKLRKIRWD
jgi:hypothetical protein